MKEGQLVEKLLVHSSDGDVLGEESLVEGLPSTSSAVALKDTTALVLGREDFAAIMPDNRKVLPARGSALRAPVVELSLSDFHVNAVIGSGAFARVALVRTASDGAVYALKKMDRFALQSEQVRRQVMNERFVLGDFDHPAIARLHATFKTAPSLLMLLAPCLGGERLSLMQSRYRLAEEDARF